MGEGQDTTLGWVDEDQGYGGGARKGSASPDSSVRCTRTALSRRLLPSGPMQTSQSSGGGAASQGKHRQSSCGRTANSPLAAVSEKRVLQACKGRGGQSLSNQDWEKEKKVGVCVALGRRSEFPRVRKFGQRKGFGGAMEKIKLGVGPFGAI